MAAARASTARPLRWLVLLAASVGCAHGADPQANAPEGTPTSAKIELKLDRLDAGGLHGPTNGLRSMAYEFCIPAGEEFALEVSGIDPTMKIYRRSPGRIRRRCNQYLCVGETHQPNHRTTLEQLAALPYVRRIVPAHFE